MATFNNGESLASVRTKINDAIDKIDGNATISNDISVGGNITVTGTVDGRDVAADGTKLDGIDQGVATTDSPTFAGLTTTADVSFGDNDKAIFGAGSDLQIYHDGSNSYIQDAGTGNLLIKSDGSGTYVRNASDQNIISAQGDEARMHYAGPVKLKTTSTGIDVTGTVTADGLTVDGAGVEVISVNSTQNGAQINFDSASTSVDWSIGVSNSADGDFLIYQSGSGSGDINLYTGGLKRQEINRNGDISFYEDTGTTQKLTWSAADEELQLASGVALELNGWTITESGGSLYFATGGTNKMKLDASGNLQVVGNVEANATIS